LPGCKYGIAILDVGGLKSTSNVKK